MLLSSTINDGMVQTIDRMAATTTNTYSFKQKMADINNEALDWYFPIAFKAGRNWEFDDTNQTLPPIDALNIVSGTNRYKVSSFTQKIIDLVKLEILDSAGTGHVLFPEKIDALGVTPIGPNYYGNTSGMLGAGVVGSFEQLYINAPSGLPTNYCKFGDFIYLRPKPNFSLAAALKAYFNRAALKFSFIPVTVTIATPGVFTATAHGLVAGDTVILETDGALPTGLTADTQYYVIAGGLTADTFELSLTAGGSAINTSVSQSGNHCFLKTNGEPGIPSVHHNALCRKAAITYRSLPSNTGNPQTLAAMMQQSAMDERKIADYFSQRDKDMAKRMSPSRQNNK